MVGRSSLAVLGGFLPEKGKENKQNSERKGKANRKNYQSYGFTIYSFEVYLFIFLVNQIVENSKLEECHCSVGFMIMFKKAENCFNGFLEISPLAVGAMTSKSISNPSNFEKSSSIEKLLGFVSLNLEFLPRLAPEVRRI